MKRRAFVMGGVTALIGTARAADAQQASKPARVGILMLTSPGARVAAVDHMRAALRELGYLEGQTIVFEYRAADGKIERLPELVRELAATRVDVIYAATAPAALAAKQARTTIPIVFSGIPDPVGAGLVESLPRPGGNVTGVAYEATPEQGAKQLEVLKELSPSVTRVGIFTAPGLRESLQAQRRVVDAAQDRLALTFVRVDLPRVGDVDQALETLARAQVDALWLIAPAAFQGRARIAEYALKNRLPAIAPYREFPDAGGLVSFGASFSQIHRRAAVYVDRILKGASPADLPVEQPTTVELVINLKTAKALGLTVPPALRLRADHVIE